jgi:hypothetical protein
MDDVDVTLFVVVVVVVVGSYGLSREERVLPPS